MPEKINTELPLEFDYFGIQESWDTNTVSLMLREYNEITGMRCKYYQLMDSDQGMDPIFREKTTKRFESPIEIKFVFSYLEEVIENIGAGIELLDTIELEISMDYFKDSTKFERPVIGSLVKIPYAGLMFEITNVVDSSAILFGQKLSFKLTCKIYQESAEDKEITHEVYDPGEAPGESDNFLDNETDKTEDLSEEQHVYTEGDNIFGEY